MLSDGPFDLGTFKLRHATRKDRRSVLNFYRKNWSTNLTKRGESWVKKATTERDVFLIEQVSTREIVALSALKWWQHPKQHDRPDKVWVEAAASLVRRLGGFDKSFHLDVFHPVRSITVHVQEPELDQSCESFDYFGGVLRDAKADHSRENILAAGFVPYEIDDDLQLQKDADRKENDEDERGGVDYFRLPREKLTDHASKLLKLEGDRDGSGAVFTRSNNKTGRMEELKLLLDVEVLRYYRGDVVALSEGATLSDLAADATDD